jgi:HlyD family secretion protein
MSKLVVVVLALAAAAIWWYDDIPFIRENGRWALPAFGEQSEKAAQYLTAPVEKGEIRRIVTTTGTLNAIVNVEVGSQLSGQIADLLVDFNDEVKKGQPLARLDQKSFQARVAEAQAAVDLADVSIAIARAKLERTEIDAHDSEAQRDVLNARVDNAKVKLEAATVELRRKQGLRERNIATVVDVEDAQTKVSSASATFREAEAIAAAHENMVSGTKVDIRRVRSELDSAVASVPQKKALLRVAEIDLERTIIRSPVNGVIVGRNVSEGQTLATTLEAKTLFIVAGDLHQMEIHAKVDEADIGQIRVGQIATFTVDAYPQRQFSATVRQVRKAPQVQQNVVTYTVVLSASNPDGILLPGMTALARIIVNATESLPKVPLAALRYVPSQGTRAVSRPKATPDEKTATIWILVDGSPQPVAVALGEEDANDVAVTSGSIEIGTPVIVGEVINSPSRRLFGIRFGQ